MQQRTSGYSNTSLAKKLGLKEHFNCTVINAPKMYSDWINSLQIRLKINQDLDPESKDFIHIFCISISDLNNTKSLIPLLKQNGMLWVSWPKGKSNIETELKREPIREFLLNNGLVDIKVAAIDDDWSGLKFVYRLKDRK